MVSSRFASLSAPDYNWLWHKSLGGSGKGGEKPAFGGTFVTILLDDKAGIIVS